MYLQRQFYESSDSLTRLLHRECKKKSHGNPLNLLWPLQITSRKRQESDPEEHQLSVYSGQLEGQPSIVTLSGS